MKKTIIISSLIILGIVLAGSCAAVSTNGNTVNVGGIDFKIPDGFEVNESSIIEDELYSQQIGDGIESVRSTLDHVSIIEKGFFGPGEGVININVYTFDSEEDAEAHLIYYNEKMILNDPKNLTINGIDGFEGGGAGMYSFYYRDGNKLIYVQVNYENSDLIPNIVIN